MAEKKKPKPGPSTGGSSTSRIKRPKGSQPLTLGTGGLRTGKVSKKQQAGTRKVVGAIAAATPVGRGVKAAAKAGQKARSFATLYPNPAKRGVNTLKKRVKAAGKLQPVPKKVSRDFNKTLSELQAGKTPSYKPSTAKKKVVNKDLRPLPQRGKRVTPAETKERAQRLAWDKNEKRYDFGVESMSTGYRGGMNVKPRGTKGKNARKETKIRKIGSN
jgi:hypothetical protein